MRTSAMFWVAATTLMLLLETVTASLAFPFHWIFFIALAGQVMVVYMVYRVLTEPYTTNKTFQDYYQDYTPRP